MTGDSDAWSLSRVGQSRSKIAAPVGSGSRLGKFVITRSIGRGGMCEVFEARHEELNKLVAVKVLKPEYTIDPIIVDRLREKLSSEQLEDRIRKMTERLEKG